MAIAFDVASQVGGGTSTIRSWTHTVGSITDGIALVYVMLNAGGLSSTPTFGGNTMTQLINWNPSDFFADVYVFYYLNPTPGANTVVVDNGGTNYNYSLAVTYSGVDQTNPFGTTPTYSTSQSGSAGTSFTSSLTTTETDAWVVALGGGGGGTVNAGTDTTRHASPTYSNFQWHAALMSSNNPISSPGSVSINTTGTSAFRQLTMMQLKPAGGGGGGAVKPNFKGFSRL